MKVILLKELRGKGGEGDVIDVAPGFANNYLLTQGYAIKATKGALRQLEERRNNIAKREEVRIADANKLVESLGGKTVKVIAQVGEEGQLFGSVTAPNIADAIMADLGIEIDRRRVELGKPIKTAGLHVVDVSIYRDIKAKVNVLVGSEADLNEPAAEEALAEEAAEEAAEAVAEAAELIEEVDPEESVVVVVGESNE